MKATMKIPHLIVRTLILWLLSLSLLLPVQAQRINIPEPVPPPANVRSAFNLDPFYQQWIDVGGFPVLASEQVSPYAVKEAAYLIHRMIGHRRDILRVFAQNKGRFSIVGYDQGITQIPEYSDLQPAFYVDIRNRGLGAAPDGTTSTSEENLLHYPGDPYVGGNVLIHELAHSVHGAVDKMAPGFDDRLRIIYEAAMVKGLWENTFAAVDYGEYWAEGVSAWFHPKNPGYAKVVGGTREALKAYDPELAALIKEVFGDGNWRYTPVTTRLHQPHLQGFDPQNSPTFQFPPDKMELTKAFTSDPESTGDGRWVNLQPYPPSELPRLLASIREGEPTTIATANYRIDDVFMYEVPGPGTEWSHGRLRRRGDMIPRGTRVGRLFLLEDSEGNLLSVYRAEAKLGRIWIPPEVEVNSPLVEMPDANLAAAVRQELGLYASTPITEQVMQWLTTLYATERQIMDITGLEHATQLVRLSAWGNQIQDVNPLSKLTQLQQLHLQGNQITDITAFAGLTELRQLHLSDNQIRDVSALRGLTKLEELWLGGNPIQDKTPLHSLLEQNPDMDLDIIEHTKAGKKIQGPWLWMVVPTQHGLQGSEAAKSGKDYLAIASDGAVTEQEIATTGATTGAKVGNRTWTSGKLAPIGDDNITEMANAIGLARQDHIDFHVAYGSIVLNAPREQKTVMYVGSDDAVKVWLNGTLVHNNPIDRGANDYQEDFPVTLKQGKNILLIAVYQGWGGWSGFFGFEKDAEYSLLEQNPDMELDIEVVLPEPADINEDGRINAVDLLLVVAALTADTPTNPRTDVNGDGVVNVADLQVVIENLDDPVSAAAPMRIETATPLDRAKLEAQLNILRAENDGSLKYQQAIAFLQNLLSVSRPGKTKLLANYPNPFNPETWIPYQLAKSAEVTVFIHSTDGKLIRTLALGHLPAGVYHSRSRAAYWDGRNETGETVASGVYFYTLEVGDFTATRKMLIQK